MGKACDEEEAMRSARGLAGVLLLAGLTVATAATGAETVFLSSQLRPIEEAEKVRQVLLRDAPVEANFITDEPPMVVNRMLAEARVGDVSVGLIGALHGELQPLVEADVLQPVDDLMARLQDRDFVESFVELAKYGGDTQYFIPWMQATYIMAAHRQALEYLPEGADLNALTYDQLRQWGANIQQATGDRRLGFPAGPQGLMHRFFQGYLYPSFTGGVVTRFRSDDAVAMWEAFADIWEVTNPRSTSYAFMQEPLLAGEVWVAFDHTARLMDAFRQRPDDFVAFPAPAGPQGRGFMPVLAGLAIPAGSPDPDAAAQLIDYLTRPEVQVNLLREVAFYPVVDTELPTDLPQGIQIAGEAIAAQTAAPDALPSLLPVGLGEREGEFSKLFTDTFQLIVLRGADVRETLDRQVEVLRRLIEETGAPCWPPDQPSDGACPVD